MATANGETTGDVYRVSIKRSARRHNAQAAEWVAHHGPERTFESKRAAKDWAERISAGTDNAVRIQDAVPHDRADVDGYLVTDPIARRRSAGMADTTVRSLDMFETSKPDAPGTDQTQF